MSLYIRRNYNAMVAVTLVIATSLFSMDNQELLQPDQQTYESAASEFWTMVENDLVSVLNAKKTKRFRFAPFVDGCPKKPRKQSRRPAKERQLSEIDLHQSIGNEKELDERIRRAQQLVDLYNAISVSLAQEICTEDQAVQVLEFDSELEASLECAVESARLLSGAVNLSQKKRVN